MKLKKSLLKTIIILLSLSFFPCSNSSANQSNNKGSLSNNLLGAGTLGAETLGASLSNESFSKRKRNSTYKEYDVGTFSNSTKGKPKGIFRKAWSKVKSFGKKAWTATKRKIAGLNNKTRRGLASLANQACEPQITHQMVYQSVEAPQIEPIDKQEYQSDPNNPIFKSYDLVRGKSAGVVVEMSYPNNCTLDNQKFVFEMDIDGFPVEYMKCLSFELDNSGQLGFSRSTPNPKDCEFSAKDFPANSRMLEKFIELPVDLIDTNRAEMPVKIFVSKVISENHKAQVKERIDNIEPVVVDIKNLGKLDHCADSIDLESANEFCLSMHVTKSFFLNVVSIQGSCKGLDLSTAPNAINDFMGSAEVKDYLPVIFPIPEPQKIEDIIEPLKLKHVRKPESLIKKKPLFQINQARLPEDEWLISPSCDNQTIGSGGSHGLGEMIQSFYSLLIRSSKKNKKPRLLVLTSTNFTSYHNISSSVLGFVWAYKGRSSYRNVLFMNESSLDRGTLFHEMAHSLGQLKEFYLQYKDNSAMYCKRFNGSPDKQFCVNQSFHIKKGIKTGFLGADFKWLENKKSIMGAGINLNDLWIDRETYQKTFRFLNKRSFRRSGTSDHSKMIISGSYNKETNEFTNLKTEILNDEELEITAPLIDGTNEEGQLNYIKIQLTQNNESVHEVRHPSDMYARIYHENGRYEEIDLPTSFVHAVIPIEVKGDFKLRFFKASVWFNNEGEIIKRTSEGRSAPFHEIDFSWQGM